MPYIDRDEQSKISGAYKWPQNPGHEFIAGDDAEFQQWKADQNRTPRVPQPAPDAKGNSVAGLRAEFNALLAELRLSGVIGE